MLVPDYSMERTREAAAVLNAAPVEAVGTSVPVYESGDLLHPLIAREGEPIGPPFTFHQFNLVVTAFDKHQFGLRLAPQGEKLVSTPIIPSLEPDFHKSLPAAGFAALKAHITVGRSGRNPFSLYGEDAAGNLAGRLLMPSQESAIQLVEVVAGLVHLKATTALHSAKRRQSS